MHKSHGHNCLHTQKKNNLKKKYYVLAFFALIFPEDLDSLEILQADCSTL